MHLQTVNRDQRGETLPRQRGEEAEETGLFFSSSSSCRCIVNILLCPAFLLLPFILQSFRVFLNAKVLRFFLVPKCIPKTLSVSVSSYPLSLPLSFTLYFLIFYLPQVHQMIPLPPRSFLPPPSHLCTHNFLGSDFTSKRF